MLKTTRNFIFFLMLHCVTSSLSAMEVKESEPSQGDIDVPVIFGDSLKKKAALLRMEYDCYFKEDVESHNGLSNTLISNGSHELFLANSKEAAIMMITQLELAIESKNGNFIQAILEDINFEHDADPFIAELLETTFKRLVLEKNEAVLQIFCEQLTKGSFKEMLDSLLKRSA